MAKYKLIKTYPGSLPLNSIKESCYNHFPEFWEKVEELDYEILNYRDYHENILKYFQNGCAINSVKRISDGEVFTIGDETTVDSRKTRYKIIKIREFTNTIQVHGQIEGKSFFYNLNQVVKLHPQQPLFTTEDNVEVFTGDKFCIVDTQFNRYRLQETVGGHFTKVKPNFIRFHSKEKAEDYILFHKPCLSIIEISNWFRGYGIFLTGIEGLTEIVKQKI